jgi:hypothetical protein
MCTLNVSANSIGPAALNLQFCCWSSSYCKIGLYWHNGPRYSPSRPVVSCVWIAVNLRPFSSVPHTKSVREKGKGFSYDAALTDLVGGATCSEWFLNTSVSTCTHDRKLNQLGLSLIRSDWSLLEMVKDDIHLAFNTTISNRRHLISND